jgi:hypothetical protein
VPRGAHFLGGLIVHVGQPLFDQPHRPFIQEAKIIRSVRFLRPLDAQPAGIFLDRLDVFGFLLGGVGVVEPQVKLAAVAFGRVVVDPPRFYVADVHVPVRLRGQARADVVEASRFQVLGNRVKDELPGLRFSGRCHENFSHFASVPSAIIGAIRVLLLLLPIRFDGL